MKEEKKNELYNKAAQAILKAYEAYHNTTDRTEKDNAFFRVLGDELVKEGVIKAQDFSERLSYSHNKKLKENRNEVKKAIESIDDAKNKTEELKGFEWLTDVVCKFFNIDTPHMKEVANEEGKKLFNTADSIAHKSLMSKITDRLTNLDKQSKSSER